MFSFKEVNYKDFINIADLTIPEGKVTTLVGASGSGKTTILKLLNKLVSPTSGRIYFKGQNLENINSVELRRKVSMLSQSPVMIGETIKDNLIVGLKFQERTIPKDILLLDVLEKVKLGKSLNSLVNILSGGEKQRLALARLLLLDAEVLLLDEPSSALDEETANVIIEMIVDCVAKKNKTVVMVTHSLQIANKYSDKIIAMPSCTLIKGDSL